MSLGALVHNLVIVLTELIYPATNQLAPFLCLRLVAFNFAIHIALMIFELTLTQGVLICPHVCIATSKNW